MFGVAVHVSPSIEGTPRFGPAKLTEASEGMLVLGRLADVSYIVGRRMPLSAQTLTLPSYHEDNEPLPEAVAVQSMRKSSPFIDPAVMESLFKACAVLPES